MFESLLKRRFDILLSPDKSLDFGHFGIYHGVGHVVDAVRNKRVADVQVKICLDLIS